MYTYVKGKGWVIETIRSIVITMRCGTKVRLEERKPEIGERYERYGAQNPMSDAEILRFQKSYEFFYCSIVKSSIPLLDYYYYITVIPVK